MSLPPSSSSSPPSSDPDAPGRSSSSGSGSSNVPRGVLWSAPSVRFGRLSQLALPVMMDRASASDGAATRGSAVAGEPGADEDAKSHTGCPDAKVTTAEGPGADPVDAAAREVSRIENTSGNTSETGASVALDADESSVAAGKASGAGSDAPAEDVPREALETDEGDDTAEGALRGATDIANDADANGPPSETASDASAASSISEPAKCPKEPPGVEGAPEDADAASGSCRSENESVAEPSGDHGPADGWFSAHVRRRMDNGGVPPPVDTWEDEGAWVVGDEAWDVGGSGVAAGNALAEAPRLDADFANAMVAWWEERDLAPATAAELLPVLTPASPVLIALLFRLGAPTTAPDPEGARDLLLGLLSTYLGCPCASCSAASLDVRDAGGSRAAQLTDAQWVTTDRTVFFLRGLVRHYGAAGVAPWPVRAAAERAFGYLGRALGHMFDARADLGASRPAGATARRARFRELAGSVALYDVHRHEAHALRWFDADPAGVARDLYDAYQWLRSATRATPACTLACGAREAAVGLGRFMPARVRELSDCTGACDADRPAAPSDDCTLIFADAHAPRRGHHVRAYTAPVFSTLAPHTSTTARIAWTSPEGADDLNAATTDAARRLRRNLRMTNTRGRVSVAFDANAAPGPAWMLAARRRDESPDPPVSLTGADLVDATMLYCEITTAAGCDGAGIAAALSRSPPSATE